MIEAEPVHVPFATVMSYVPPEVTTILCVAPRLLPHVYVVYPEPTLSVSDCPLHKVELVATMVGVIGAPTCIVAVLDVSEHPFTVTMALYVPAVVALVVLWVWPPIILPLSIHTYDPPDGLAVSV